MNFYITTDICSAEGTPDQIRPFGRCYMRTYPAPAEEWVDGATILWFERTWEIGS